jgi:hypothetical protein
VIGEPLSIGSDHSITVLGPSTDVVIVVGAKGVKAANRVISSLTELRPCWFLDYTVNL